MTTIALAETPLLNAVLARADDAGEYDGQQHLTSRSAYANDVKVARVLHRLQWHIVHVIKEDRPADVLAETCSALISHGWQP